MSTQRKNKPVATAVEVLPESEDSGTDRFDMKIDRSDDREKIVSDMLRSFKGKREASAAVKKILYEYYTGKDWYTGHSLQPIYIATGNTSDRESTDEREAAPEQPIIYNQADLDALDDDLSSSWGAGR